MSLSLQIVPLRVGYATGWAYPDGTVLTFFMFAILGGPRPILVDTGTYGARRTRDRQGLALRRPRSETPAAACRAAGIEPADVELVIQTHLHWDHTGNGSLFPNAELLVQRDELRYAIAPPQAEETLFDRSPGVRADWVANLDRMRLVDGDYQVESRIRTIHLPGHTPGFQAVLVDTASGKHLIAGDTVPTYAHWRGDGERRHLLGPATHPETMERSLARIDALDAIVIPGHDGGVFSAGPFR